MFRYKELIRLKRRDFELWAWKAQKVTIAKEMLLANLIRTAMGTNAQYRQFYNTRKSELLRLDGTSDIEYKEAWASLKIMKGG